jgi:hypothetical protein
MLNSFFGPFPPAQKASVAFFFLFETADAFDKIFLRIYLPG